MNLVNSLWYLGRGTGLVALVMFTLTMVLGITTRSGRQALGLSRFGVADLHKTASLTGAGLVAVHVTTLLFDPYAQLRLVDLVFPFLGAYRPLWLGLGTLHQVGQIDVLGQSAERPQVLGQRGARRSEEPSGVHGRGDVRGDRHRVTTFRGSRRGTRAKPRSAKDCEVRQPRAPPTARAQPTATARNHQVPASVPVPRACRKATGHSP